MIDRLLEGRSLIRGLELRRRILGHDREAKRRLVAELVPEFLRFQGTRSEDWYTLSPRGVLYCHRADEILELAEALRTFVLGRYQMESGFASFTFGDLQERVMFDGRALTEKEEELVKFVLMCLGVGGGPRQWDKPLDRRLENLIEADGAVEPILAMHAELLEEGEIARSWDQNRPTQVPCYPSTTYNFHGPVGAVATAPGAVAHSTVHIQAVDEALHQLVELQDTLGELADLLFPLLRRVRQSGIDGTSEEELRRVIADANEVKEFEGAVKTGTGREAVEAARKVLSGVSTLASVLALLAPG